MLKRASGNGDGGAEHTGGAVEGFTKELMSDYRFKGPVPIPPTPGP